MKVKIVLLKTLRYHGKRYESGEVIEVSEFEAKTLVDVSAAAYEKKEEI